MVVAVIMSSSLSDQESIDEFHSYRCQSRKCTKSISCHLCSNLIQSNVQYIWQPLPSHYIEYLRHQTPDVTNWESWNNFKKLMHSDWTYPTEDQLYRESPVMSGVKLFKSWERSDDTPIPRCVNDLCSGVKCKDCWNLIVNSTYKSIQQNRTSENGMKRELRQHFETRFKLFKEENPYQ